MYKDKREYLPNGLSLAEYIEQIIDKMPTSTLSHRETWALKEYIKQIEILAGIGYND